MKIISKFRDYYDIGLSHGIDPNLIFHRVFVEEKIDNDLIKILKTSNKFRNLFLDNDDPYDCYYYDDSIIDEFDNFILIYLGNIYNVIREKITGDCYYKYEEKLDFLLNDKKYKNDYCLIHKNIIKTMLDKNPINDYMNYFIERNIVFMFLNSYLYEVNKIHVIYNYYHEEKTKVPAKDLGYRYNDKFYTLNYLQFFKVKDPYTTFNEISMYMGGILSRKENEMINIKDVDMLKKKGFDDKSFKKSPDPNKRGKIRRSK